MACPDRSDIQSCHVFVDHVLAEWGAMDGWHRMDCLGLSVNHGPHRRRWRNGSSLFSQTVSCLFPSINNYTYNSHPVKISQCWEQLTPIKSILHVGAFPHSIFKSGHQSHFMSRIASSLWGRNKTPPKIKKLKKYWSAGVLWEYLPYFFI